jgi:hypothetical protein
MEYEDLFSIEILNKETGEIGLVPSPEFLTQPKHVQLAELKNCLEMYEEELKNINNDGKSNIIFENEKGKSMNIESGNVEIAVAVIRKYIKNLTEGRI